MAIHLHSSELRRKGKVPRIKLCHLCHENYHSDKLDHCFTCNGNLWSSFMKEVVRRDR